MDVITVPDLANACEMAREDDDLEIVSQMEIDNLEVEDWAKLSHAGERFKVKVEEIKYWNNKTSNTIKPGEHLKITKSKSTI